LCLSSPDLAIIKMQDIVAILIMFMGAASGLLFQDPVVCKFTESNQCYAALGQQLHLQMPRVDMIHLKVTDKTFTDRLILKYRHHHDIPLTVYIKSWQFVNDTLILKSAETSDYGTYTLQTFDAKGNNKGIYTLQLNIE
ncbi:carcinoembryonic antigen-related cell adhesion molecule 5-like isoform X1, partial [Clarias magur]